MSENIGRLLLQPSPGAPLVSVVKGCFVSTLRTVADLAGPVAGVRSVIRSARLLCRVLIASKVGRELRMPDRWIDRHFEAQDSGTQ